ncbi:MAG: bifunctional [glutamine synthetase] adenylyltransferase/[glutamine synthetase]-adenylyl-L-tyrosine phosphorylase [Hyphomicrobiales bacterium]|nr:bifunctional [glutamine synthetase] adenylyltransferase/[glutamine synthetase]-adenylyl-L-tyrosine phosphorylase [Hyphomicrobiales bacterium]
MGRRALVINRATLPGVADHHAAETGCEDWLAALNRAGDAAAVDQARGLAGENDTRALLSAIFGNSSFLTQIVIREPIFFLDLISDGPDATCAAVLDSLDATRRRAIAGEDPSRALRIAKRRLALAVAVADIANVWPVDKVCRSLSEFADLALRCAVSFVLVESARQGVLKLAHADEPEHDSGLIVLGMGKLGAFELNYSSDIDLILLYDAERMCGTDVDTLQQHLNRLTRRLVKIMSGRTADGYVLRVDLRLRPDPASTPPIVSLLAAEVYYETLGQNWERAALIKARAVAGDLEAGAAFIDTLRPFIWRKHLDFAAIQDIHSIKRQIDAHRGGGKIAVAGHNVKLGRGGIREIEFFVQTQQLIWGGRQRHLCVRGTIECLSALTEAGHVTAQVAEELSEAYEYLRRVEHRLQMVNDEQTHVLPEDPERLAGIATFLGYASPSEFKQELITRLRRVETHYGELFGDAPALSMDGRVGGNLVFTGSDSDPETLKTLERLGFGNPTAVDAMIRSWHRGRYDAMRSTRARELLTELTPALLLAFSEAPDANAAFFAFDKFLEALPAGIALFSMFHAHPELLSLLVEIIGVAPTLGDRLARRPSLLDSVLSGDFYKQPPQLDDLVAELEDRIALASCTEEVLDGSRRWANDRKFQVGVQSLRGVLNTRQAGAAWSNIAEAALRGLLPAVEAEFASEHGHVEGCEMAIIGMGKLGSREMTAGSDLDLIFVYGMPEEGRVSNGAKPLPASQYFARLSQRFINAITSPTTEGRLYTVDMRLRPSGKAGPIAVSSQSFRSYQLEEAWTWEKMALTRARPVAGSAAVTADIQDVIYTVLTQRRDPLSLVSDVADMRRRMAQEHQANSIWDVKHMRGGMVDVEFICQYLQLLHGAEHPQLLTPHTADALDRIRDMHLIDAQMADCLCTGLELWQAVRARIQLTVSGNLPADGGDDATEVLRRAVSGMYGLTVDQLVERMRETAAEVRDVFRQLIEEPAQSAAAAGPLR